MSTEDQIKEFIKKHGVKKIPMGVSSLLDDDCFVNEAYGEHGQTVTAQSKKTIEVE